MIADIGKLTRAIFAAAMVFAFTSIASAQGQGQTTTAQKANSSNPDIASFNRFLSEHPDVEKQLEANPSLIRDPNFLSTQPALKTFLSDHPDVRAQLEQSPVDFVRHENGPAGTAADRQNANGLDSRQLGRLDEFFDEHRDIEQQLELNPWLVNDPNFMGQHRDLQNFLNTHAEIRQEFTHDPGHFMQQEHHADSAPGDHGITNREIGQMDQFLEEHRDVAQQLQEQPVLINDSKYLSQHADLSLFLNQHPAVRFEFTEHPGLFTYAEKQTVAANTTSANPADPVVNPTPSTNTAPSAPNTSAPPPAHPTEPPRADTTVVKSAAAPAERNVEVANAETTRLSQFLDDHPNIQKDLNKNPYLINQAKYLKHHKELAYFLQEHPQIQNRVAEDPQYFTHWKSFGTPASQDGYRTAMYSGSGTEMRRGPNVSSSDLAEFDRFLSKHKKTAKELENDPALVTSQHYVDHNKDLRKFFEQHGQVLEEFRQNPRNFMQREDELHAQLR